MPQTTFITDMQSPSAQPRRLTTRDEDGGALLAILVFGMLASLVMLALVGRMAEEARGVADSLAQTRAYWAAMGVNNYALEPHHAVRGLRGELR